MSRDAFSPDPREQETVDREPRCISPDNRAQRRSDASETASSDSVPTRHFSGISGAQPEPRPVDSPRAHELGDRTYFLHKSELRMLGEIGTFRAVAAADLARIRYDGDTQHMERDVRRLQQQSLLTETNIRGERNKTIRLLTLTKKGARLARQSKTLPDEQMLYRGFVKPREAKHDADLYRLYQVQAERIERAGGHPTRVVLDFELKRNVNRDLAAVPRDELTEEMRERIAERHGLTVVNGKIPVPDLRLEYDTAEMEHKHLDLELATRNYRPRSLAEKAKAGFSFYARRDDASRLRRVLDEREISAEIFSL